MSTDNTEKEKGFVYQALYALKIYFENSEKLDYVLGYETNGDVTLWEKEKPLKYFEIKHHQKKNNMTKSNQDFWKTIKNAYSDYTDSKKPKFDEYILITTEKNKFFDEKRLFEIVTGTTKEIGDLYFDLSYDEEELKNLLKIFKIKDSQKLLEDLLSELYKYIVLIPVEENKRSFILELSSAVDKGTIFTNSQDRKISFSDLRNTIKVLSSKYVGGKQQLLAPTEFYNNKEQCYLEALKLIQITEKSVLEGVQKDYLFTMYNKLEHLKTPLSIKNVEKYETDLTESLVSKHRMNKIRKKNEIDNYAECIEYIEKTDLAIDGVEMKEIYHRGSTHYLVNEGKHFWKYMDKHE